MVGGGGASSDVLDLFGTQKNDTFQLTGTGPGAGFAEVSSGPLVQFTGLGTSTTINLIGNGGNDNYTITQFPGFAIPTINIEGSINDTVHLVGTSFADAYTYTPLSATSARSRIPWAEARLPII